MTLAVFAEEEITFNPVSAATEPLASLKVTVKVARSPGLYEDLSSFAEYEAGAPEQLMLNAFDVTSEPSVFTY